MRERGGVLGANEADLEGVKEEEEEEADEPLVRLKKGLIDYDSIFGSPVACSAKGEILR